MRGKDSDWVEAAKTDTEAGAKGGNSSFHSELSLERHMLRAKSSYTINKGLTRDLYLSRYRNRVQEAAYPSTYDHHLSCQTRPLSSISIQPRSLGPTLIINP